LKYLITGGAGFVGSHLCDLLLERGHRVVVLDDLSSGDFLNISPHQANRNFEFVESRAEAEILHKLVPQADVVFHLAATVGVFNVIDSPATTLENNIDTTADVLRAATINKTKVIVASTSEVYGKTLATPFREDGDVVLGATSKSRWSYAASKMVDEFLALAYWQEYGVPTVVVRLFNTIGPRQIGRYGMVVPRFISQALADKTLSVFGDGSQSRCFTYVGDVVEWLSRLATIDTAIGQVFNLGNSEEVTILELAERVIKLCDSSSNIEFVPYSEAYGAGFEEMQRRVPDASKVIQLTGHRPEVSFDDALQLTRDWLIEQGTRARSAPIASPGGPAKASPATTASAQATSIKTT
jgi:UDP-glucose 4-epimerase